MIRGTTWTVRSGLAFGGSHQPMSDQEESVWVVFNGEIYNFPELKSELEAFGHIFRTRSDTEVIVHGYKQWGDDVLNHLNGMFGLAIWDVRQQRLVLARDPFGIKLIYYAIENGRLYFGSEVTRLRRTPCSRAFASWPRAPCWCVKREHARCATGIGMRRFRSRP